MTAHPNSALNKANAPGDGDLPSSPSPKPPPSSTPFRSRTNTAPRGGGGGGGGVNGSNMYYHPSVHQFTCRGAFHLRRKGEENGEKSDGGVDNSKKNSRRGERDNRDCDDEDEMEALLRDTFLCNGVRTRLRHVADYPLARSKEEAMSWFEGSSPAGGVGLAAGVYPGSGFGTGGVTSVEGGDGEERAVGKDEGVGEGLESVDIEPNGTFSSYGTTQVNILSVRKVPVTLQNDPLRRGRADDPFGGFGTLSPSGMLNPFGSLFGGFFGGAGGGPLDPWSQHMGEEVSDGNSQWTTRGSRSVSSSTRMERDKEGKRVVTTVTNTTTVDSEGRQRTETTTTKRHLDDGGRVETSKAVKVDGDKSGAPSNSKRSAERQTEKVQASGTSFGAPRLGGLMPRPSLLSPQSGAHKSPPEVAVIATDCLLGVSVSDSPASDPDGVLPQKSVASSKGKNHRGMESGWRKTEYLFRLGRFIPPFMVVNRWYRDEEEEELRRKELRKEYDDMCDRMRRRRWDRLGGRDAIKGEKEDNAAEGSTPTEARASTPTEYYLQRMYVQMGKNADMMGMLLAEMANSDFPKKVQVAGGKVLDNIGPTAERTSKLMFDVWDMWMGSSSWGNGWSGGGKGGSRQ